MGDVIVISSDSSDSGGEAGVSVAVVVHGRRPDPLLGGVSRGAYLSESTAWGPLPPSSATQRTTKNPIERPKRRRVVSDIRADPSDSREESRRQAEKEEEGNHRVSLVHASTASAAAAASTAAAPEPQPAPPRKKCVREAFPTAHSFPSQRHHHAPSSLSCSDCCDVCSTDDDD